MVKFAVSILKSSLSMLWLVFSCGGAVAADHCSLVVSVVSPQGDDVEAWVTVRDFQGRTIERENVPGGVRFCELGILPVTVIVGRAACNQVTVRNVPLVWEETYKLKVVFDFARCISHGAPVPVPQCLVLFRIKDDDEEWIEGASVTLLSPSPRVVTSDQYGRAVVGIARGADVRGNVWKEGYRRSPVAAQCSPQERRLEREVTLVKE